jgi:hypothetical protein
MFCVSESKRLGRLGRTGKALTLHQLAFFLPTKFIELNIFDDFSQAIFCFVSKSRRLGRLGRSGTVLRMGSRYKCLCHYFSCGSSILADSH